LIYEKISTELTNQADRQTKIIEIIIEHNTILQFAKSKEILKK